MIVKNEAHVIIDCLESVRPLADYMLIEDTGSTDGTQELIRSYLAREGIAGEVIEEPWRDFAHNRSLALSRLRERTDVDFALMIDADEVIAYDPGFDAVAFKKGLTQDLYSIKIRLHSIEYSRPQLVSNRAEFRYRGVLHEFVEGPPGGYSSDTAEGFCMLSGRGGARSKNPRKYEDDAAVLERTLQHETDPFLVSRYTFYLAQSYRDSGRPEKALPLYLKRTELGFWDQETFISLYSAAQILEQLGRPDTEVVGAYLRAYEACPWRAEALHGAMRYCRLAGKHHQSYLIGRHAVTLQHPAGGLFVQPWVYEYGVLDEFSIAAYWAGHYQDSFDASQRLLREDRIPAGERSRVLANMNFALKKLPGSAAAEQPLESLAS
ncbi:glycosyltransferase [Microvirga sesbaniae]|uniref:glycosyltransferase n=1 Tax=Microvirga sesbaniae TaxID=681392 RepID=UPI0021C5D1E4|nr:glycosyltransferase [Microvirga sp. HBU67692]